MSLTDFEKLVLKTIKNVPAGQVTTYSEIARSLKNSGAARAVGNALNKNPHSPIVPCHRVVKSGGVLGGFARGSEAKKKLLTSEGVLIRGEKILNFKEVFFKFKNRQKNG